MIKRIYSLMFISLVVASCNKSEPTYDMPDSDTIISFTGKEQTDGWGTKSITRGLATNDVDNAPSNIMVYSFIEDSPLTTSPYINNQEAVKDAATNIWHFEPKYYYLQDKTLSFLAYLPKPDVSTEDDSYINGITQTLDFDNQKVTFGYDVPLNGRNQPDLMLAAPKAGCNSTNQVGILNFKHVLTKITLSAKMADGTEEKYKDRYKITHLSFHNIKISGSLDYSVSSFFGDWYGGKYGNYVVEQMLPGGDPTISGETPTLLTTGDGFVNIMNNGQALFMVPQPIEGSTNSNGKPSIQITITDNEPTIVTSTDGTTTEEYMTYRTDIIPLPSPEQAGWQPGKAIDLQFEFMFDPDMVVIPMSLTAKLMQWTNQNVEEEIEQNIYAWLDVKSVLAGTTTTLKLYTNGVVTSASGMSANLGGKNGDYYPIEITPTTTIGTESFEVVIKNSRGKTITKKFYINVE